MEMFEYRGFIGQVSMCNLAIELLGGEAIVLFVEMHGNPGASITNASEGIAAKVLETKLTGVDLRRIRWFEHYPADNTPPAFDEILYEGLGRTNNQAWVKGATWSRVKDEALIYRLETML